MTNKRKLTSQQLFNLMIEGIVVHATYWLKDELYKIYIVGRVPHAREEFPNVLYTDCEEFFKEIKLPKLLNKLFIWFLSSFNNQNRTFTLTLFLNYVNVELKNNGQAPFEYKGEAQQVYQCYQSLTYKGNPLAEHMRIPSSHNLVDLAQSDDLSHADKTFFFADIEIKVSFLHLLEKAMRKTLKELSGKYFVSHYKIKQSALKNNITQCRGFIENKRWDNAFESVIDFVLQASAPRKGVFNFFPASFGRTRSVSVFFNSLEKYCGENAVSEVFLKSIVELFKDRIKNEPKHGFSIT